MKRIHVHLFLALYYPVLNTSMRTLLFDEPTVPYRKVSFSCRRIILRPLVLDDLGLFSTAHPAIVRTYWNLFYTPSQLEIFKYNPIEVTLIFNPFKNPLLIAKDIFYIYFLPTHLFLDILPERKWPKNCAVLCCFRHSGHQVKINYDERKLILQTNKSIKDDSFVVNTLQLTTLKICSNKDSSLSKYN